jgi:putative transposase
MLCSYNAAEAEIGLTARHGRGLCDNNLAEHWQQLVCRGERKLQQFQLAGSVQRFLFAPCAVSDPFTTQRPLLSCRTLRVFRTDALEQWRAAVARSRRRIGRVLSGRLKLGWPRPRDIAPLSVRR